MAAGLTHHRLYRLRDSGELEQVGRGLFRKVTAELADFDLLEAARRAPSATICLLSALAHHGLTDAIPSRGISPCPEAHGTLDLDPCSTGTASTRQRSTSVVQRSRSMTPPPSVYITRPEPSSIATDYAARLVPKLPTRLSAAGCGPEVSPPISSPSPGRSRGRCPQSRTPSTFCSDRARDRQMGSPNQPAGGLWPVSCCHHRTRAPARVEADPSRRAKIILVSFEPINQPQIPLN